LDEGLHLLSNLSVVLVDEPEQELTLFCKAVIHSVLYMAASPRKIPGSLFPQFCGDPLNGPLPVLRRDVWVDALVPQVRDNWPEEGFRLLHVVERWRYVLVEVVHALCVQGVQAALGEDEVGLPRDQR